MTTETSSTPQIKFSWLIGTLAALTIFAVIGAYSSSVANHTTDYDDQRAIDRIETLAKLQKEANDTLTSSDWVFRCNLVTVIDGIMKDHSAGGISDGDRQELHRER